MRRKRKKFSTTDRDAESRVGLVRSFSTTDRDAESEVGLVCSDGSSRESVGAGGRKTFSSRQGDGEPGPVDL